MGRRVCGKISNFNALSTLSSQVNRAYPSEALNRWLQENRARGCTPAQLLQSMIDAGYSADFAGSFVVQAGISPQTSVAETVGEFASNPALHAWWRRVDALATGNSVALGDREALIRGRHTANGIFYLRKLLDQGECDAIIELSSSRIQRSTVVDPQSGDPVPDPRRSSQGTFFEAAVNPLIAAVEARLARLCGLPVEHGEGLQILHYTEGGEYQPHYDYFDPSVAGSTKQLARGGQRIVTIIMYLNTVEQGGGTIFPELGLEFLPEKGAALMFSSLTRDGRLQSQSLHGGSPVKDGVKWIATRWIRINPYG